jgi:hypothetical protein
MQEADRAIHVHARDGDDAARMTAEQLHQLGGLAAGAQDQIDHDVGRELAECGRGIG